MDKEIGVDNMEVAQIMDLDRFITTYKSIFYAMTASAESKSAVFDRRVYVEMDDLCELYERITNKLDIQFRNAGSKVKINVSFDSKRNYSFDNWQDFSERSWHDTKPITSVIIKWEYHIIMPEYPVPQPHVLVVKISDGLKMEQMLNLIFTGKIENIELLEEELYPVVARVDYINHELGDELLNIVSEWDKGLKKRDAEERVIIKKLRRNKGKWASFLSGLMKILVLLCSMLFVDWYIINLPTDTLFSISTKQACILLFIAFVIFVLYSLTKRMANFCLDSFFRYIDSGGRYHVFGIDKGDKQLQNEYKSVVDKNIRKALIGYGMSIAFNIICGIISSIIATKIFL